MRSHLIAIRREVRVFARGVLLLVAWLVPPVVISLATGDSSGAVGSTYVAATGPLLVAAGMGGLKPSRIRTLVCISGPDMASLVLGSVTFGIGIVSALPENTSGPLIAASAGAWSLLLGLVFVANQQAMLGALDQMRSDANRLWHFVLAFIVQPVFLPVRTTGAATASFLAASALLLVIPEAWPSYALAGLVYAFAAVAWGWDAVRARFGRAARVKTHA